MLRKFFAFTLALLLVMTIPLGALAEEYDLANGSITVEAEESGQYVSQENGVTREKQTTETVIKQTDSDTSSTTNTITIKATGEVTNEDGTKEKVTAEVTISDVNIDVSNDGKAAISAEGDGNVTIELEGSNVAESGENHAGVEKSNGGNLTITDADADGSLEVTGAFVARASAAEAGRVSLTSPSKAVTLQPPAERLPQASAAAVWVPAAILPLRATHR